MSQHLKGGATLTEILKYYGNKYLDVAEEGRKVLLARRRMKGSGIPFYKGAKQRYLGAGNFYSAPSYMTGGAYVYSSSRCVKKW